MLFEIGLFGAMWPDGGANWKFAAGAGKFIVNMFWKALPAATLALHVPWLETHARIVSAVVKGAR